MDQNEKLVFRLVGAVKEGSTVVPDIEFTVMPTRKNEADEVRRVVFEIEPMPDEEETLS